MHTNSREPDEIASISAIIADDEPMAREYLRLILSRIGSVEVLAEAQEAAECLEKVRLCNPDMVFLDIHLPDATGLEVAEALSQLTEPPLIVFVTGYEDYALPAFEVAAVDYVTKPFSQERLEKTLDRVRSRLHQPNELKKSQPVSLSRLTIRDKEGAKLIPVDDICYINTNGRKIIVHTKQHSYAAHHTLAEMESRLRDFRFFRANEGCLVNLDKVQEVVYEGPRTYELLLWEPQNVFIPLSRSRTQKLRDLLNF